MGTYSGAADLDVVLPEMLLLQTLGLAGQPLWVKGQTQVQVSTERPITREHSAATHKLTDVTLLRIWPSCYHLAGIYKKLKG